MGNIMVSMIIIYSAVVALVAEHTRFTIHTVLYIFFEELLTIFSLEKVIVHGDGTNSKLFLAVGKGAMVI